MQSSNQPIIFLTLVAHKQLKTGAKRKFYSCLEKEREIRSDPVKATPNLPTIPSPLPNQKITGIPPFVVITDHLYILIVKHVIGDQCFLEVDRGTKLVNCRIQRKAYLIPEEFRKTEYYQQESNWNGRFDNYPSNTYDEDHFYQLPDDANVEQECIKRYDRQTLCGWMVEFHFKKQIRNTSHLEPNESMWGLFYESVVPGRGCDAFFQKELEARQERQSDDDL